MGVNGQDIAQALAATLSVTGVRTYAWMPDTFQPPGIVVGAPAREWATAERTFCTSVWTYPLTIAVARNSDREAQSALFLLEDAISDVLGEDDDLGGVVQTTRLIGSDSTTVPVNGQELPGRVIIARILA